MTLNPEAQVSLCFILRLLLFAIIAAFGVRHNGEISAKKIREKIAKSKIN